VQVENLRAFLFANEIVRKDFSGEYATETFYFPLSVQTENEDSEDLYDVTVAPYL
jgi:hypothetical protein